MHLFPFLKCHSLGCSCHDFWRLLQAAEANKEMLELLVDFLPRRFPDRFVHTEKNELLNMATGDVFNLNDPALEPLEVCSLLVQVCQAAHPSILCSKRSSVPLARSQQFCICRKICASWCPTRRESCALSAALSSSRSAGA